MSKYKSYGRIFEVIFTLDLLIIWSLFLPLSIPELAAVLVSLNESCSASFPRGEEQGVGALSRMDDSSCQILCVVPDHEVDRDFI